MEGDKIVKSKGYTVKTKRRIGTTEMYQKAQGRHIECISTITTLEAPNGDIINIEHNVGKNEDYINILLT